mmetsp:Transcript_16314/g.47565  ORF Transcript_16314/g.47565 Transcript_16314/m.47565 type:complete len:345 (-) Transcript_16314:1399-2433(-)
MRCERLPLARLRGRRPRRSWRRLLRESATPSRYRRWALAPCQAGVRGVEGARARRRRRCARAGRGRCGDACLHEPGPRGGSRFFRRRRVVVALLRCGGQHGRRARLAPPPRRCCARVVRCSARPRARARADCARSLHLRHRAPAHGHDIGRPRGGRGAARRLPARVDLHRPRGGRGRAPSTRCTWLGGHCSRARHQEPPSGGPRRLARSPGGHRGLPTPVPTSHSHGRPLGCPRRSPSGVPRRPKAHSRARLPLGSRRGHPRAPHDRGLRRSGGAAGVPRLARTARVARGAPRQRPPGHAAPRPRGAPPLCAWCPRLRRRPPRRLRRRVPRLPARGGAPGPPRL